MIIDTQIAIRKIKRKEVIKENLSIISIMEYPPILLYEDFYGKIFKINETIQILSIKIQEKLRKIGRMMSVGDLLILATAIHFDEELITSDRTFYEAGKEVYDKIYYLES